MTDVLIHGVPDDVMAAIDARAGRAGLSRTEYLRRTLARDARPPETLRARAAPRVVSELFADFEDDILVPGVVR